MKEESEWGNRKRGKCSSASPSLRRNTVRDERTKKRKTWTRRGRESKRGAKARTHIISVKASFVGCRCWSSLPSPSVSLCLLHSLRHCWIHNLLPYSSSFYNSHTLSVLQHGRLHNTAVHSEHVWDEESEKKRGEERQSESEQKRGRISRKRGVRKCG